MDLFYNVPHDTLISLQVPGICDFNTRFFLPGHAHKYPCTFADQFLDWSANGWEATVKELGNISGWFSGSCSLSEPRIFGEAMLCSFKLFLRFKTRQIQYIPGERGSLSHYMQKQTLGASQLPRPVEAGNISVLVRLHVLLHRYSNSSDIPTGLKTCEQKRICFVITFNNRICLLNVSS